MRRLIRGGIAPNMGSKTVLFPKAGAKYTFNGTDQFAQMATGWQPLGLPYTISATGIPTNTVGDGSNHAICGPQFGTNPSAYINNQSNGQFQALYADSADAPTFVLSGSNQLSDLPEGETVTLTLDAQGVGTDYTAVTTGSGVAAGPLEQTDILLLATSNNGGNGWQGPLWDFYLTDNSPLQARNVMVSNNARAVTLNNPIILPGASDWDIEFGYIRIDKQGDSTGNCRPFGSLDGVDRLVINDSQNVSPDRVTIQYAGSSRGTWSAAANTVAQGQHVQVKLEKRGVALDLYVDGVQATKTGGGPSNADFNIQQFYTAGSAGGLDRGAALGNLTITDITNDIVYFYPLDEDGT